MGYKVHTCASSWTFAWSRGPSAWRDPCEVHGFMDAEMKTHKSTCNASLRLASWHFKLANSWVVGWTLWYKISTLLTQLQGLAMCTMYTMAELYSLPVVLYSLPILPNRVCMLGSSFDAYHFMVHATGECICAVKGRKLTCLLSMHYF